MAATRDGARNFRRDEHSNGTHASTTDPEAKLYREANGQLARLCFMGHVLMANRNGLVVEAHLGQASGTAVSPRMRKRIEEAFGWAKTKLRGMPRNAFKFTLTMAAYNLIRMPRLLAPSVRPAPEDEHRLVRNHSTDNKAWAWASMQAMLPSLMQQSRPSRSKGARLSSPRVR
jgi:hypothetical protein